MKKRERVALGILTTIAAGTLAGSALGAYTPRLTVVTSGQQTQITISQAVTDEPTARVVLYVPLGVGTTVNQPPRTQIGSVQGRIVIADLGGQNQEFTGSIATVDPAEAPPTAAACSPGPHQSIWVLSPSAAGATLDGIPMLVDTVSTGPEAAFASLRIQMCFRPPDTPQGTPGRAGNGAKIVQATFTLLGVVTPAASAPRWNALFTPYVPGTGQVNEAGAAQSQATTGAAARLSLQAKLVTVRGRRFARLTGRIPGASGVRVQLRAGGRLVATVTTNASGAFTRQVPIARTTTFQVRATVPARDATAGGCSPAISVPAGGTARCASVTAAAYTTSSPSVKVTVPKARRGR